jgi:excisionase family DNA binding protein
MKLEKDLYTIEEVAVLFDVTKPTVYDWMNRRGLVWIQVGGRRRITKQAIEAFLDSGVDRKTSQEHNPRKQRTPALLLNS